MVSKQILSIGALAITLWSLLCCYGTASASAESGNRNFIGAGHPVVQVVTDTVGLPESQYFVERVAMNYQAPCKPGTRANVTTWHAYGGLDTRRAFDWRCHEGANNGGYDVYAPHGGVVKVEVKGHPEMGTVYIDDIENNACAILFHMQTQFNVTTGQHVAAGERIGSYYPTDNCGTVNGSRICASGHVHMIVQDGSCITNNYGIIRSKEMLVQFNEFGQLLSPRITLEGTAPGNTGAKKSIIVGECAGNLAPCSVPKDNEVPIGHLADVPLNHPFFPYIETLYYLRIVSGNGQGNFEPDRNLTRGEASKLIVLGIDENRTYNDGQCAFDDVCPGHAHYHTIRRLKELGITSATQSLFSPDDALTRGGMAKFVVLGIDRREPSDTCVGDILGVPCTHTFYKYVRRLKQIFDGKGFTLGNSQGLYNPDDSVRRGEASKIAVIGLNHDSDLPTFYDVPHDSKFLRYINGIAERGITQGCDSTSSYPRFCPEQALSRGQAAAFIVRSFGFSPYYASGQTFSDTPRSNTFFHHVEFLARNGIVNGFSDGTFRPDASVTRGEIAKMIISALNYKGTTCQADVAPRFSDVANGHLFFQFIQCMAQLGVTHGYSDGQYKPDRHITRAEAAKFIFEAFLSETTAREQEGTDQSNNAIEGATPLATVTEVKLPTGDVDWLKFTIASNTSREGTAAAENLYLLTLVPDPNVDVNFRVTDALGVDVPTSPADQILEFEGAPIEHALLLSDVPPGDYAIVLSNQKTFATEGVNLIASITELDPALFPPHALGDVTCDNTANTVDALFILQYDAGLRNGSSVCPLTSGTLYLPACDVDRNGLCTIVDALFVLQCDVLLNNMFCPASVSMSNPDMLKQLQVFEDERGHSGASEIAGVDPGKGVLTAPLLPLAALPSGYHDLPQPDAAPAGNHIYLPAVQR